MKRPDYGVDAPSVVAGFGLSALTAGVVSWFLSSLGSGVAAWLAVLLAVGALLSALLGASMLTYSYYGKQRMRDYLLGHWIWRGDETVLDIGAGRGLIAVAAAKRVPIGRVIALDIWSAKDLSGNSAEALKRNADLVGVAERLEIVTADAFNLPFADQSIDVVCSMFCIHNIEPAARRAIACREIARVLKPGGMALITDFPTVRPYLSTFRSAGLSVDGPNRGELIALGISGHLIARKPA